MFKVRLGDEDADKKGLIIGLELPNSYKSRLGALEFFNKVENKLKEHEECPDDFTMWPVSVVMPCRRAFVYKGPDDFPLENVPCRCKNPKHRPIVWSKKPSKPLGGI